MPPGGNAQGRLIAAGEEVGRGKGVGVAVAVAVGDSVEEGVSGPKVATMLAVVVSLPVAPVGGGSPRETHAETQRIINARTPIQIPAL